MKKIWKKISELGNRIGAWWFMRFKNTVVKEVEFEAFRVVFRKLSMDIESVSGNMKLSLKLMQYPHSFLLHCATRGDLGIIEWFCKSVYQFITVITTDSKFAKDVDIAFNDYVTRLFNTPLKESDAQTEEFDIDFVKKVSEQQNISRKDMKNKVKKLNKKIKS